MNVQSTNPNLGIKIITKNSDENKEKTNKQEKHTQSTPVTTVAIYQKINLNTLLAEQARLNISLTNPFKDIDPMSINNYFGNQTSCTSICTNFENTSINSDEKEIPENKLEETDIPTKVTILSMANTIFFLSAIIPVVTFNLTNCKKKKDPFKESKIEESAKKDY
ncbi:hypothetical protein ACFLZV_02965 [Candidatus Margulisiibacteriota bacterium]